MYREKFDLTGRVAIVTGGGRGLGRQMALALAGHGAALVLAARTQTQIDEVAAEVRDSGARAIAVATDVTDRDACFSLVEAAVAEFGRLDVLVNNAGFGDRRQGPQDLLNYPPENWLYSFDVNLNGAFHCTQAAGRVMVAQGEGGSIINNASATGLRGNKGNGAYGAAKAALISLTKTTAINLAEFRIRANALAPGHVYQSPPAGEDEVAQRLAAGRFIPVGRRADAWELGALAAFLASDASSYVSGQTFIIDGGGLAAGYAPNGFAPVVA